MEGWQVVGSNLLDPGGQVVAVTLGEDAGELANSRTRVARAVRCGQEARRSFRCRECGRAGRWALS
jgi:hypothetical protein